MPLIPWVDEYQEEIGRRDSGGGLMGGLKKVRVHVSDPIYVGSFALVEQPRKIELRIGQARRGQTRYAALAPREAQQVAIALLLAAEESLAEAELQPF
jgi:hypothetical protein